MKSQLEKKLDKLPYSIELWDQDITYELHVKKKRNKTTSEIEWVIEYIDTLTQNTILHVVHRKLEACIDNAMNALNKDLKKKNIAMMLFDENF